jgi:hypothetical protein
MPSAGSQGRLMRDWTHVVRQHLAGIALDEPEAAQVVEELASHLEETYQFLTSQGHSDDHAVRKVLSDVGDWEELKRKIERSRKKEFTVAKRVAQFWLPAFLTLFSSMLFLLLIQYFGPDPVMIEPTKKLRVTPVAVVYVSWLLTLPFIGSTGAYLSLRAGGRSCAALFSVVFPVLPYLACFVVGLPLALILDDQVAHNITIAALFVGLSAWVIFPAIALLAGGLLVQQFVSSRLSSSRMAGS